MTPIEQAVEALQQAAMELECVPDPYNPNKRFAFAKACRGALASLCSMGAGGNSNAEVSYRTKARKKVALILRGNRLCDCGNFDINPDETAEEIVAAIAPAPPSVASSNSGAESHLHDLVAAFRAWEEAKPREKLDTIERFRALVARAMAALTAPTPLEGEAPETDAADEWLKKEGLERSGYLLDLCRSLERRLRAAEGGAAGNKKMAVGRIDQYGGHHGEGAMTLHDYDEGIHGCGIHDCIEVVVPPAALRAKKEGEN